jgi:hypothetical protein
MGTNHDIVTILSGVVDTSVLHLRNQIVLHNERLETALFRASGSNNIYN